MGCRPQLHGDVVEEVTSVCGATLDQVEVLGEEGNDPEDTEKVCCSSQFVLVDLGATIALTWYLDLDQPLSIVTSQSGPDDRAGLVIGDESIVGGRPERLEGCQIGKGLEEVGLPGAVGPDEEIDFRVGPPIEMRI
jgi:hypothetical protein